RIVQAAIGSASCVFLALAAERLVSRRAGIAAGLMLALYAPAIFFDGLIQKSVLDVFFVCIGLYLAAQITVRLKPDTTGIPVRPKRDNIEEARSGLARNRSRDPGSVRLQADRDPSVTSPWDLRWWFLLGMSMGALALTR